MKKALFFVSLLVTFFFGACQSSTDSENEQVDIMKKWDEEVMAIHDEIMPLTMKLKPLEEQLNALKIVTTDATVQQDIEKLKADLNLAYTSMYDWMRASGKLQLELETMEEKEALRIIQLEKTKIEGVKEITNNIYSRTAIFLEGKK